MGRRRIKIEAIRRKEPDVRLYVLALIELARQLQAEDEARERATSEPRQEDGGDV